MSADLFAEFEAGSAPAAPQKPGQGSFNQPSSVTHNPQAFANPSLAPSGQAPQRPGQPAFPWQAWSPQPEHTSGSGAWSNLPGAAQSNSTGSQLAGLTNGEDEDDEDGWGDFAVAAPAVQPSTQSQTASNTPPGRIVRANTLDLVTNNLLGSTAVPAAPNTHAATNTQQKPAWAQEDYFAWGQQPATGQGASKSKPNLSRQASNNVLFDADDYGDGLGAEEDDDDFGDFETGKTVDKSAQDLLGIDSAEVSAATTPMSLSTLDINDSSWYPSAPHTTFRDRNPFPGLSVTTPPAEVPRKAEDSADVTPQTAWPSAGAGKGSPGIGENWVAFEDFLDSPEKRVINTKKQAPKPKPASIKTKKVSKNQPTELDSNWDWDFDDTGDVPSSAVTAKPAPSTALDSTWDWDSVATKPEPSGSNSRDDIPPINIPPPSVLMSIFPQLLGQADTYLFKPTTKQAQSVKDQVYSDPKTLNFLRGYFALARVAARIIAGRKSRWHRDKFLAQSMSISASGSKGMKLAGVDKAQTARESREAGDVVDLWKAYVGRLRSVLAAVNAGLHDTAAHLKLPEISENMHVSTAKDVPTAAKACIICGLKREERLTKVDCEVEDSFGEWWADHWGHVECKRFWLEHEAELRQR